VAAPKGKIVKVDRSEFVDINEKIAKRNNVEAFRARFEKRKARAPRGGVTAEAELDDGSRGDDLDGFLQELQLDDDGLGECPGLYMDGFYSFDPKF
jgi:hypothetical protein